VISEYEHMLMVVPFLVSLIFINFMYNTMLDRDRKRCEEIRELRYLISKLRDDTHGG